MHTNMQNEDVTYNIEYWQIYQKKKKKKRFGKPDLEQLNWVVWTQIWVKYGQTQMLG